MVFYTPMDMVKELMKYEEPLGLEFNGKKYSQIIEEIQENCPHIYNQDEIEKMCKDNLSRIEEKYGFRGVRIWFHSISRNSLLKSYTNDDLLERKYYKFIPHIGRYHEGLMFDTDYFLNVMIYYRTLEDVYYDMYGSLMESSPINPLNEAYYIMKVLHISGYDENLVNAMQYELKKWLRCYNAQYYLDKDLTSRDVLDELYLHLAEECYDDDAYEGFAMFKSNDGYGNTVWDKCKSWKTDDGYVHYQCEKTEGTIKDYKIKGTVND